MTFEPAPLPVEGPFVGPVIILVNEKRLEENIKWLGQTCSDIWNYLNEQPQPAPAPIAAPTPPIPSPTVQRRNGATVQIQGHDITENNLGAVPDTNPRSGKWMLSYSWDQETPISARDARQRLAALWTRLTPKQQHRRSKAYFAVVDWINEALKHSPPGRMAGEHFAYQNPIGDRDDYPTARVDVAVFSGVAFDVP